MCVSPFAVYDIANFHGYGFTRGTPIGRHAVYGSSALLRLPRRSRAHGSSGSSPGFSPPSSSMSTFDPPPTHGPVKSTLPSGSRGIDRLVASASDTVGLGRKMNGTSPAAGPGAPPPTCCASSGRASASVNAIADRHARVFMNSPSRVSRVTRVRAPSHPQRRPLPERRADRLIRQRDRDRDAVLVADGSGRMSLPGRIFDELDLARHQLNLLPARESDLAATAQRDHELPP